MKKLKQTPSQTVGPFFAYSLTAEQYGYDFNSIINDSLADFSFEKRAKNALNTEGGQNVAPIYITGKIIDGAGNSVPDAIIELWQADEHGQYRTTPIQGKNDGFTGFGRLGTGTNAAHRFTFKTVKPASVNGDAPHVNVIIFMRGLLLHVHTRLYFSDEMSANAQDSLLSSVEAERRDTLIAHKIDVDGTTFYEFNIHLQGEKETVFFDI
ncbi:MAG: protocatechuate 3,4-dioxygenase subunit alpha [Saprospiraceae bacterium]|nr:protocatechuate 3,4-dioxygenase subunit alpha [Saprospiraceae bacterium]